MKTATTWNAVPHAPRNMPQCPARTKQNLTAFPAVPHLLTPAQTGTNVFAQCANALDSCLPENSMLYFPILNQLWTFTLAPININNSSPHNIHSQNNQQQSQHEDNTLQRRNPLQQTSQLACNTQNHVQTTLQNTGQFNLPPGFAPDGGWTTIN